MSLHRIALALAAATGLAAQAASAQPQAPGAPPMQAVQGPNFAYVLPAGWSRGEEGNHALALQANDGAARIIVFGSSGFAQGLVPQQYAQAVAVQQLRLGPDVQLSDAQAVQPLPGYTAASLMTLRYTQPGPRGPEPMVGFVLANVVSIYQRSDGVVTMVHARESEWARMASWLPQVALQAVNTGPNPFGRTGMSGTILGITARDGQRWQAYRAWSQQNWAAVVDQRAASIGRRAEHSGSNLTAQEWRPNPYTGQPERYSTNPRVIWANPNGAVRESADPNFDPRTVQDPNWRRVR